MRTLSNKKNLISNHPKLMGGIVLIYRIFRYMLIYLINGPRNFFILIWLTNMEGGSWGPGPLYRFLFFDNSIINQVGEEDMNHGFSYEGDQMMLPISLWATAFDFSFF